MASRKGKVAGKYEAVRKTLENYKNSPEMAIPSVKEEFDVLIEPIFSDLISSQIETYAQEIEGVKSLKAGEILERCRTSVQSLIIQIVQWGETHRILDLSPEAVKARLEDEMRQVRGRIIQDVQKRLGAFDAEVKKFDPQATLELRGSLATGRKKTGKPFNPEDFDVDAFIKSDVLWNQAIKEYGATDQSGKIWADTSGIPGLAALHTKMFRALEGLAGMRPEFSLAIRSIEIVSGLRRKERHIQIREPKNND